jgi:hypothetical protein
VYSGPECWCALTSSPFPPSSSKLKWFTSEESCMRADSFHFLVESSIWVCSVVSFIIYHLPSTIYQLILLAQFQVTSSSDHSARSVFYTVVLHKQEATDPCVHPALTTTVSTNTP